MICAFGLACDRLTHFLWGICLAQAGGMAKLSPTALALGPLQEWATQDGAVRSRLGGSPPGDAAGGKTAWSYCTMRRKERACLRESIPGEAAPNTL